MKRTLFTNRCYVCGSVCIAIWLICLYLAATTWSKRAYVKEEVSPNNHIIRTEAMNTYTRYRYAVKPNVENDMYTVGQYTTTINLWIPTTNPRPIYMFAAEASLHEMKYQSSQPNIRHVMREIFSSSCEPNRPLVFDIGAKEGFYALLSSAYGCRTYAFELQSECIAWLSLGIAVNDFGYPARLMQHVIGKEAGVKYMIPQNGCSSDSTTSTRTEEVTSVVLDQFIYDEVLLLRIDAEGNEINVLESAKKNLQTLNIKHVIFRMSHGLWRKHGYEHEQALDVLNRLIAYGYLCRDLSSDSYRLPRSWISSFTSFDYKREWEKDIWCTCSSKFMNLYLPQFPVPNDQTLIGLLPA